MSNETKSTAAGIVPLACWLVGMTGCLALAALHPRLWASAPTAGCAVQIVATGLCLLLAVGLPIWMRAGVRVGVAASGPVFIGLAGLLDDAGWLHLAQVMSHVVILIAAIATIWAYLGEQRRFDGLRAIGWCLLLCWTACLPVLGYLIGDFAGGNGMMIPWSLPMLITATFYH